MYINAEFPAGIDSFALYEMVVSFKLNVLDLKDKIYLYGNVSSRVLPYILDVCQKFSFVEITIKNPTS